MDIYSRERNIGESNKFLWFLAYCDNKPAGLIRLTYDPPLEFLPELNVTLEKNIDLKEMAKKYRFVEIGRFMIIPKYRRSIRVALRLMRSAIRDVVERGYTYLLTDVFENEPNSPLHFHTKILGFERIGSHLHGELNCNCTRIILILDILKSYQRLKARKDKIFKEVTDGIKDLLDERISINWNMRQ